MNRTVIAPESNSVTVLGKVALKSFDKPVGKQK